MSIITFDIAAFRAQFTAFADSSIFSNGLLNTNWDLACCFISPENYGFLNGHCREQAIMLLTAHITQIGVYINSGRNPALLTGATIDKVSVTATPPPASDQLAWWFNLTGYGQQAWALLSMNAVGGAYYGGAPVMSAFRKYNGLF